MSNTKQKAYDAEYAANMQMIGYIRECLDMKPFETARADTTAKKRLKESYIRKIKRIKDADKIG